MSLSRLLLGLVLVLAIEPARADDAPPRIGVAAPLAGPLAALGAQVVAGAKQAAAKGGVALVMADTQCTADGGRSAAETFVAAKADIVVGFLCTEALEAALPVLKAAAIPAIDVGVRADRFTARRAKTGDLIWRVAPRSDAEATAVAKLIVARWRDIPFGLLDDGSIAGRSLADAVRSQIEAEGIKPADFDTFRPAEEKQFGLVRRIMRTGVTHFFLAGERGDAATIARDAASNGLAMEIIGGERFLDEPADAAELPLGTLAVAPQNRIPPAAPPQGTNIEDREGYFGPSLAATEIAAAAVETSRTRKIALTGALNETEFQTSLGAVRFDGNGDSSLDLFRVFRFDGRDFTPEAGG